MLTDRDAHHEHDAPYEIERSRERDPQMTFPVLEEPSWLEDDDDLEEVEAPRDSPFRGIWIGIAAAAITFALVFAIPHWLGWYDVGPPTPSGSRDDTPESVISTVTAQPSRSDAEPPPTSPPVTAPTPPPPAAPAAPPPKSAPPARSTPAPPARTVAKPPSPAPAKRTFAVQIGAFKSANPANRLAARVKRDGYPADVRRIESAAVPWVVRVGTYATREQAEAARDALAGKGFRGFISVGR